MIQLVKGSDISVGYYMLKFSYNTPLYGNT